MKKINDEFKMTNLPKEAQDRSIKKEDFRLVQANAKIHDQKFETKPTTFFRDCLKRFAKNKSSVVATVILGILLVMSVVVPVFAKTSSVHETDTSHPELYYLEPKLFKAGTGFWDGTKKMVDIPVNTTSDNPDDWAPDSKTFNPTAISDLKIGEESYVKNANKLAKGGYIQFGYFDIPTTVDFVAYSTDVQQEIDPETKAPIPFELNGDFKIKKFVTLSAEDLKNSAEQTKTYPEGYVDAESALFFTFNQGIADYEIQLTEYAKSHDVGGSEPVIDVKSLFSDLENEDGEKLNLDEEITNPAVVVRVKNAKDGKNACTLIQAVEIKCETHNDNYNEKFNACSFASGNEVGARKSGDKGFWKNISLLKYSKDKTYLIRARLCSFTYDTYEAVLGKIDYAISITELDTLNNKKIIRYNIPRKLSDGTYDEINDGEFECTILDEKKSPLIHSFTIDDVIFDSTTGLPQKVNCEVFRYKMKPYNLDKMPKFLLGTDVTGRDMFIYVFEGLRTSLLLGIATTVICFLFGLFWGSVSGYFGGNVDLVMERLTDILSGVPWIVVMTLTIIKLGSTFFTFALALCLTGWIGTAATTRTQFYRFRGREYVLASRTLGASHGRLIAKHILPNAMGTIITSAVLMVPSVIFSEATISYLGLGFKNLASLGVILSDNQIELTNHPYLLIFPSVIIALLMISFNLFGNGLRDAVNPSLKGEGE